MKSYNSIFSQAIDQFMNQSLSDVFGVDILHGQPSVNILEEKDKHILKLAIPGIPKEDVDLKIEKDKLIISTNTRGSTEEDGDIENPAEKETVDFVKNGQKKYERKEFDYTHFSRSFHLPETADKNKVSASYNAGILTVEIAKKEEAIDHGPIHIKVS